MMREDERAEQARHREVHKLLGIAVELGALLLLINYFHLESQGFFRVMALASAGFVVHYFLPLPARLPFFLALSVASLALILGWQAVWIVGIGVGLLAICHLNAGLRVRVAVLLLAAGLLAVLRAGWLHVPWSGAIWPILASMFMFRLIVYLYDVQHESAAGSIWQRLSYFFLLPNVCFPLFPVVDYKTFRRTYYDGERHAIYQAGVQWVLRGLIHLILYRLVYYYLSMAPHEVQDLGDLMRYVVSGFLLYLRISGQFHIIVGMLKLFGFNLPETHHLYMLASSFNDFWRRINIYWKDFMMKAFFYPLYFRLRKHGEMRALLVATAGVFVATWLLHAYQWFWIRGSYLLTWTDVLFWGILAVLVMANTYYETRHGRARVVGAPRWTPRQLMALLVRTAATGTVIVVLWSLWTSVSVSEWVTVWRTGLSHPTIADTRLVPTIGIVALAFGLATCLFAIRDRSRLQRRTLPFGLSVVSVVATALVMCAVGSPELYAHYLPSSVSGAYVRVVGSTREVRLSGFDTDMLERGYYEDLLSVQRFNTQLWEVYASWPLKWSRLEDTGILRLTGDFLGQELVPSKEIHFRDAILRTNQWGMRGKDYDQHPSTGSYRFAVVGSSHVMGYGVDDEQTFASLLEQRLNAEGRGKPYARYEVLNFAVWGYTPLQELFQMDHRVFAFEPHAVLYFAHYGAPWRTPLHLLDMVRSGVPIPYPELRDIVARAGIDKGTNRFEAEKRIDRYHDEILSWVYRHMVAACREHGAVPVWLYLPQVGDVVNQAALARLIRTARDAGFITMSLTDAFEGHAAAEIQLGDWDHHPNPFGHRLLAASLFEKLRGQEWLFDGRRPAIAAASY
jgi:D-alanyl-lipoteichoic acid acyltransferase DltB (MBOAT superfamily)